MKYWIFFVMMCTAAPAFNQIDCTTFKKGKFEYLDLPGTYFVIDGNKHTEYIENGKYYIESTLKWKSGCTYVTVLKKSTVPDLPFKPGDEMTVTFTKIEEGIIYFAAELKGEKSEGRVKKTE